VACRDSSTRSSAASCAAGFSPADSRAFTAVRAVSIGSCRSRVRAAPCVRSPPLPIAHADPRTTTRWPRPERDGQTTVGATLAPAGVRLTGAVRFLGNRLMRACFVH
jgi:hypothetical protein